MTMELLLEAERRGILPPEKKDLLREARRRGLLGSQGPSQRQAERESMRSLREQPPDVSQQAILPGMTGGMITPESLTAALATGGGAVGGLTGTIAAPGPGTAGGMLAGSGLGAAAGRPAFHLAENIARRIKGMAPYRPGLARIAKEAATEGVTDVAFSAGTMAAGPLLRRIGKPLVGRMLGTMTPEARRTADMAHAQGIEVGAAHVSPRKVVKGASKVLGIFPFVGTPLRRGQARVVGQIDERAADLLNTLAPVSTKYDLGKALTKKAAGRYKATDRIASALYKRFYNLADKLSVREVVPTEQLQAAFAKITGKQAKEAITLTSGEPFKPFTPDALGDFIKQIEELPSRITVEQARGLERQFNRAIFGATKEGYDVSRLRAMKEAMEAAKNNIDVSKLDPAEADAVVNAWNKANAFFARSRRTFETPTARRFGRVDKNIFGKGVFKTGTVNADDVFKDVFQARSPEALDDLRKLVGNREFRRASRAYLTDALNKAAVPAKEGSLVETLFSAADFEKRLGLNTQEGWDTMTTMLRGSGSTVGDWRGFLNAAKTATNITIRDPSTFLTRRLILGGSLIGGVVLAGSKLSLPVAGLVTWMARKGAKGLMSKEQLRLMTRVIKDTTTDHQRRAALVRLIRLSDRNDRPERPTGRLGAASRP